MTGQAAVWVALITTLGVVAGVVGSIYAVRKTTQQTEKAARQDDAFEADKTGIEGLRELAVQNRLDREEWRKERADLIAERQADRKRLDKLEQEVRELREEREQDKALIVTLQNQIAQHETLKHALIRYIRNLREFITGLGKQPPEPELPLPLD